MKKCILFLMAFLTIFCGLTEIQAEEKEPKGVSLLELNLQPAIEIFEQGRIPRQNYTISEAKYEGRVEAQTAHLTVKYEIMILEDRRTAVPILSGNIAITTVKLPKDVFFIFFYNVYK